MKKLISFMLVLSVGLFVRNVYADTNIKVGESSSFKHALCKITNCTSSSSNVTVSFDENECKYTGVSEGESVVEVTCDGEIETKKININVNNTINSNPDNSGTLYDNVTSAEVNCSSLGLLRKDLQGVFKVFKIVAPILVIVLSIYDFVKALAGKVDGEIKKVFMKLLKRLAFAIILFFLPNILDFFLGLVDSGYTTCIND